MKRKPTEPPDLPEYAEALAEYNRASKALSDLDRSIGLKLWELSPWSQGWRNPHREGTPEYEAMQAVRARGMELVDVWRAAETKWHAAFKLNLDHRLKWFAEQRRLEDEARP